MQESERIPKATRSELLLTIKPLPLSGPLLIEGTRHEDERGAFEETYRESTLAAAGVHETWVQDNQVYTAQPYVLRGLHFQAPPYEQSKLIRTVAGRILDIVVDLRSGSPTYGEHIALELSRGNCLQLYVPAGFAHGYLTLEPHCHVLYKVSRYYAPESEGGLLWSDEPLGIRWPVPAAQIRTNDKDQAWPGLADLVTPFV